VIEIRLIDRLPSYPEHEYDADGNAQLVYAETKTGFVRIEDVGDTPGVSLVSRFSDLTIEEFILKEGWQPAGDPDITTPWNDRFHRDHSKVWRYWITTPDAQLPGVRDFVAAAEAGGLPEGWTEKAAESGAGDPHTVCTFRLTMDGARSLGAEQSALMALADLPGSVCFFQTVAPIDGFTGVEKESRQPDTLETALYEPRDLFQTSHPDAAGQRGSSFGEADVLDVTGLTLT